MKRRRRAEEEDTADSCFAVKKKKVMEDFWDDAKIEAVLQEIANARKRTGRYSSVSTGWGTDCWNIFHMRLKNQHPDFENVSLDEVRAKIHFIHSTSNVDFRATSPPSDDWDRIVYNAFVEHYTMPPPPPPPKNRKRRSVSNNLAVNLVSNRTSTNSTNVHTSGSCSSSIQEGQMLAQFFREYLGELNTHQLTMLGKTGNYGLFVETRSYMSRDAFIQYLVEYAKQPLNPDYDEE